MSTDLSPRPITGFGTLEINGTKYTITAENCSETLILTLIIEPSLSDDIHLYLQKGSIKKGEKLLPIISIGKIRGKKYCELSRNENSFTVSDSSVISASGCNTFNKIWVETQEPESVNSKSKDTDFCDDVVTPRGTVVSVA